MYTGYFTSPTHFFVSKCPRQLSFAVLDTLSVCRLSRKLDFFFLERNLIGAYLAEHGHHQRIPLFVLYVNFGKLTIPRNKQKDLHMINVSVMFILNK